MSNFQLPQYQCHKVVRAARITGFRENGATDMPDILLGDIGAVAVQLSDWHAKHKPQVGGYYVVYEDGYASYSPAKAFEEGYTLVPADHRDRVRAEAQDRKGELDRLSAFIKDNPTFATLPAAEQQRMRHQRGLLLGLVNVLSDRIAAFDAPPEVPEQHTENPDHAEA